MLQSMGEGTGIHTARGSGEYRAPVTQEINLAVLSQSKCINACDQQFCPWVWIPKKFSQVGPAVDYLEQLIWRIAAQSDLQVDPSLEEQMVKSVEISEEHDASYMYHRYMVDTEWQGYIVPTTSLGQD